MSVVLTGRRLMGASGPAAWRRGLILGLAAILAAVGLLLFGQGVWLYAKAALAQALLERAFAETVRTGAPVKPWPWADTWPVARIAVPRLRASAVVLAGASGQALAFGPGHLAGTASPGEAGPAVYAAHRDTHFAFLRALRAGDRIIVTRRDGVRLTFTVTNAEVVRWDASGVDPDAREPELILTTCWPFDAVRHGPLRYLVRARAT